MTQRLKPTAPCKGDETVWFPGNIKPAYAGVYQRQLESEGRMWMWSRFDGVNWHIQWAEYEYADRETSLSTYQNLPWRGLCQDPTLGKQK